MKSLLLTPSIKHPKLVMLAIAIVTVVAALQLPKIQIDTDPENMLPADEPVRVTHAAIKEAFNLNDFLVVGIVHEDTVFTPETVSYTHLRAHET